MSTKIPHNFNQSGINYLCSFPFKNDFLTEINETKNFYVNSSGISNDISTSDSCITNKNNVLKQPKDSGNCILLKNPDEFINELFKRYSEDNCLCNYSIFEKNIDINMNLEKNIKKKISLSDYFDCFNNASFLCLNIPLIEPNGSVNNNIFNPTFSSMVLLIKSSKKIDEKSYKKYIKENFTVHTLNNKLIKIEFNESNPPYHRDIIDSKIKIIYKIMGKKRLNLDDVIKDKSYFSILWSPVDINKNNSSFLSYYSFDFKLLGSLIIKRNDNKWFTTYSYKSNKYKDFKKDYLYKENFIKNFLKNYNGNKEDNILENKYFPYDYKCFIYTS